MNRRGKRIAFTTAAVGLAVILVFGILRWDALRDHVEAWRFQRGITTETIIPDAELRATPAMPAGDLFALRRSVQETEWSYEYSTQTVFRFLANYSGFQVIHASRNTFLTRIQLSTPLESLTPDVVRMVLAANGWHVLEQRLPRRAWVVVQASTEPPPQAPSGSFTRTRTVRRRRSAATRNAGNPRARRSPPGRPDRAGA